MARNARIIVPGAPHHVTQRGNRRQTTFFTEDHYSVYLDLLFTWCKKFNVEIISYCLMPNHVHEILIPADMFGMTKALSETHMRYTRHINFEKGWRGCLWQGRYFSVPLDEQHFENAIRYVEMNPVRAGMVSNPADYIWSSASGAGRSTLFYGVVINHDSIRSMTSSGRPECSEEFRERILQCTGIDVFKKKAGRPKRGTRGVSQE